MAAIHNRPLHTLRRAVLPLAVIAGTLTSTDCPRPVAMGAVTIATGLASGGLAARIFTGAGLGWAISAVRSGEDGITGLDSSRPVIARGNLSPDRGLDRWGNHQHDLYLRTLRQGGHVVPARATVRVRSRTSVAPGPVRIKGFLKPGSTVGWSLTLKDPRLLTPDPAASGRMVQVRGQRLRAWLRQRAEDRVRDLIVDPRRRQLLRSLFFGRAQEADAGLQSGFRRLGLGHLFAVSGLHVGILAGLAWVLGCDRPRAVRRLAVATLVIGYALMLDPRGSVARAATVLVLWQGIELAGRRLDPVPTLLACVAGLVLIDRRWIADLGLQLSVLAVLGILILGVPAARRLTPRLGVFGGLFAIGLGAQAATVPLTGATFHWLAPVAPIYGMIAIPWAALVLSLGVVGVVLPHVPLLTSSLAWLLSRTLGAGVWLADLPPNPISGWPVTSREAILYGAGLILFLMAIRTTGIRRCSIGVAGVALMAFVVLPSRSAEARLTMLDVGQGDATLVQVSDGSLLIDGGSHGRRLLGRLADHGVRSLDVMIVTHPDRDHCGGGRDVLRWIPVREVWTPLGWEARCYWDLLRLYGHRLRPLWAGRELNWRGIRFDVLGPSPAGTRVDNDDSLVLLLAHGSHRTLLTGDIEYRGEQKLLRRASCAGLAAQVLKVAHHGSRSSTRPELLECVNPRIALVSAGAGNSFGHPSSQVLERLGESGARILRTDESGDVAIPLRSVTDRR